MTVNDTEDPVSEIAGFLSMNSYTVRRDNNQYYISSRDGKGRIPVLDFHRLGPDDDFELTAERFEYFFQFLGREGFHVISDVQFFERDYTFAPNGSKLIVLGSDDAAAGVFYYKTEGDLKTSPLLMEKGRFVISEESMVFYLNQYLPVERGRRNFTFYITFDAIPFRQTGGGHNPGFPYRAMPVVRDKLHYLEDNYYIGNHTMSHFYSEELDEIDFIDELIGFYDIMESYGIDSASISTLAYSFGIGHLDEDREKTLRNFQYKGAKIIGAFDYDGYFSWPVDSGRVNIYDISRAGVDNGNYGRILEILKYAEIYRSRRAVLAEVEGPASDLSSFDWNGEDMNYIIIGK